MVCVIIVNYFIWTSYIFYYLSSSLWFCSLHYF